MDITETLNIHLRAFNAIMVRSCRKRALSVRKIRFGTPARLNCWHLLTIISRIFLGNGWLWGYICFPLFSLHPRWFINAFVSLLGPKINCQHPLWSLDFEKRRAFFLIQRTGIRSKFCQRLKCIGQGERVIFALQDLRSYTSLKVFSFQICCFFF